MSSKIAFVFSGQGAQVEGMGRDLYENYPAAKEVFDFCGHDFNLTQDQLNQTINAQPAIYATALAAARALESQGIVAQGAAGFSLGEIPALAFAGLLGDKDALELVNFRAEAMHKCSQAEKGGMAAVMGMDASAVIALCNEVEGVYPVNFNAPGQTVVAFKEEARERFTKKTASAKAKVVPLKVSGAFHSPLMQPAANAMEEFLASKQFNPPKIPLYSNVTGKIYGANPAELLTQQVSNPVQWQALIEQMISDGFNVFIETGPGKTLAGLIKRINKDVEVYTADQKLGGTTNV